MFDLLEPIFTGYSILVLLTAFIRYKDEKTKQRTAHLNNIASIIVSLASLTYIFLWLSSMYESFQSEQENLSLTNRMTGPYWFGYWIFPFCYVLFPQLFWIRKLRRSTIIRVVAACLLLFALYIGKFVILMTTLHRDYLPSGWSM